MPAINRYTETCGTYVIRYNQIAVHYQLDDDVYDHFKTSSKTFQNHNFLSCAHFENNTYGK